MMTNRPAPNAAAGEMSSGTKGSAGLNCILKSPTNTTMRNGNRTMTRNNFEESPTTELPSMLSSASAQMKATPTNHFSDTGPTVASCSSGRKYDENSTNSTG